MESAGEILSVSEGSAALSERSGRGVSALAKRIRKRRGRSVFSYRNVYRMLFFVSQHAVTSGILLAISIVAASRLCRGEKALCRDKDVLDFSITCAAQVSFGTFFEIALLGVASGLALGWSWLVAFLAARNRVPLGIPRAVFAQLAWVIAE